MAKNGGRTNVGAARGTRDTPMLARRAQASHTGGRAHPITANYCRGMRPPSSPPTPAYADVSAWTWSAADLATRDPEANDINGDIWRDSPARGATLVAAHKLTTFGGLQDLDLDGRGPLPWTPDLVGADWWADGQLVVVGSVYSPFFGTRVNRGARMSIDDYHKATDPGDFLRRFRAAVVAPDEDYYEPLGHLLAPFTTLRHVALTDLSKAALGQLGTNEKFGGGDQVTGAVSGVFPAYVDAGWDWTLCRITACPGRVVVMLGHQVKAHFLARLGRTHAVHTEQGKRVRSPRTPKLGQVFRATTEDRALYLAAAYHPAAFGEKARYGSKEKRAEYLRKSRDAVARALEQAQSAKTGP